MEQAVNYDLNRPEGLLGLYKSVVGMHFFSGALGRLLEADYYCSKCAGNRMHNIQLRMHSLADIRDSSEGYRSPKAKAFNYANEPDFLSNFCPAVFLYECLQCKSTSLALLRMDSQALLQLAIHPDAFGGISTSNSPMPVKYYLDQAMRSEQSGARSAAAAMYRAALEHLLFEQGFKRGVLNDKIKDLMGQVSEGTGPIWTKDLDAENLDLLRQIGNGSLHTNEGDITKQAAIDEEILLIIREVFEGLLNLVYELPIKKETNKKKLLQASLILKK